MSAAPSPWERDGVRPPVHEATPKAPAKAVSTVMITLSNLLQLKVVFELISFEFSCVVSLVFLFSHR